MGVALAHSSSPISGGKWGGDNFGKVSGFHIGREDLRKERMHRGTCTPGEAR